MLHKDGSEGEAAITAFGRALELEPRYANRAYFRSDLAGPLFETGQFDDSALHHARAIELGDTGLVEALLTRCCSPAATRMRKRNSIGI